MEQNFQFIRVLPFIATNLRACSPCCACCRANGNPGGRVTAALSHQSAFEYGADRSAFCRPDVTQIMLNSRMVLDTQTFNIIWPENLLATL
jgi:hypothetical protein